MVLKRTLGVLLALALTVGCAQAQAGPLTLVKDGKPNATIVVQADAPAPVQAAGADLQRYIQKISGVLLPIKTDGKDAPGLTLNVGKTDSATVADLPDAKLNPETYAIRQRGDDVYFAGNYPSPTAFAVYSFLQDQLGVRWFAPGDDWEFVPQSTPGALTVDVKNVVSVPGTSPRIWSGHQWTPEWKNWNLRNKTVVSEKVLRRNFQNNMYNIFPRSKYGATHPEYYPLVNGKRWIPADDKDALWWPCIGNPEVQRITVEYIQQWFKDHPNEDSFSLGMDDIVHMCSDPLCRALDARADDLEKREFSSRYYKFINTVAKQVKKTNPDKTIGVLIYRIVLKPPVDVPKMEDNVFGYLANDSVAEWYIPGRKAAWMNNTREWAKRVKYLSRYEYFGLGTFAPRVFPHNVAEMMELDNSLGFEGSYVEMYTFLPQTAPMLWAFAQKQWNPKLKMDDLLNAFYTNMYGSAAPTMKAYFDLMEKSWNVNRPGRDGWVNMDIIKQANSITFEATDEGMALLNRAYDQAKTPVEKRRIDVTRAGLQYAGYAIQAYALAQRISTTSIESAPAAQKAQSDIEHFGKLIAEREKNWPKAFQREDLLGDSLRGLKGMVFSTGDTYLRTNTTSLENPAIPGILRLLDWYHENRPAQAAAATQQLMSSFPAGNIRDAISAWSWVQQNRPASLLKNGDFEDNTPSSAVAAEADWGADGAPAGWSTWSRYPSTKFLKTTGRTGSGTRVQSNADSGNAALLIQNVKLDPSKKYLGIVWVKSLNADKASSVTITFYFRTDSGWLEGSNAKAVSHASPSAQWQPIVISSSVPEGATSVAFMVGTEEGDAIVDDAALYEIDDK